MSEPIKSVQNHELEKLRVELLFQQNGVAQTAAFINASIFAFFFSQVVPSPYLVLWLACFVSLFVSRLFFLRKFERVNAQKDGFVPAQWETRFSYGVILSGLIWGSTSFMIPRDHSSLYYLFLGFVLAGMTAGASVAYSTSLKTSRAFMAAALIPYCLKLLMAGTNLHFAMAALVVCYFISFLRLGEQIHKYAITSIELRYEKDEILRELHLAQSKMVHAAKMAALGEMAGAIAHEINNPLGIILGESQLIRYFTKEEDIDKKTLLTTFEKIEGTVLRIAKIINGMLAFSREAQSDPLIETSVKSIIEDTLYFCQSRFKNRQIRLEVSSFSEGLKLGCRGVEITQVLLNLLNNAIDAVSSQRDKWVRIEVQDQGENICITVIDSGEGIPEQFRDKITQPFFTTKEIGKGTGLGLSISKNLIESHNGTLKLDVSSVNTKFIITLPKMPAKEINMEAAA